MWLILVSHALLTLSEPTLEIAISHPPGYRVDVDDLVEQVEQQQAFPGCTPYRVLEQRLTTEVNGEEITDRLRLELDPLLPGDHLLGFYSVRLRADVGPDQIIVSDATTLTISPPPPSPDLAQAQLLPLDEHPQPALSPGNRRAGSESLSHTPHKRFRVRRLFWQALLVGGALAASYFGLRRLRLPSFIRRRDPRKIALAALAQLEAEKLAEQGNFDLFYVKLTGIVRHFIEDAFGLRAPERTTEEFLQEAADHPTVECGDLLQFADLVKFARVTPNTTECSGAISSARELVADTFKK